MFAERIAEEEDKVITAGTGSGQPTGLTNCSIGSVACSGNLSFDDIINLIYLLPAKYRINAKFLVHNNNIRELRKLKDSQNRYLWQEAVAPGQPATFYGYNRNAPINCEIGSKIGELLGHLNLRKIISSQAYAVMRLKVQRLPVNP